MEEIINHSKSEKLKLTDENEPQIVKQYLDVKKNFDSVSHKYKLDWKDCENQYHCTPKELDAEGLEWQSNIVLPWAYDSVESAYSHLHQTMLPRDEQVFDIAGRTQEDHDGADAMQKYLEHRLDENSFSDKFGMALKQLLKKNHTCVKKYWKRDTVTAHRWTEEESKQVRRPEELTTFNGVFYDVIDIDNFWFFPTYGDFSEATQVHRTFKTKSDIKRTTEAGKVNYINLDKVEKLEEKKISLDTNEDSKQQQGLTVDEVWFREVTIDKKTYHNYIATIVDESVIIRCQPNPNPSGETPFIWMCANPDGVNNNLGYGLLSKGRQILAAASEMVNNRLNELRIKIHGNYLYWQDETFNPFQIISRAGALVPMDKESVTEGNLRPLNPMIEQVQIAYAEVAELKAEYESVTVPKVVKGLLEAGNRTATEIQGVTNNSSGKLHVFAHHINSKLLKPMIEGGYEMYYDKIHEDPSIREEMARLTQKAVEKEMTTDGKEISIPVPVEQMVANLPSFLPLPEVDVKVIGYQNTIKKQEALANLDAMTARIMQTPAAKYLQWYELAEDAVRLGELDKNRLIVDGDRRKEIDKNEQEAVQAEKQMLIMKEKTELDIEKFKEEQKAKIDIKMAELKEMELLLRYGGDANVIQQEAGSATGGNGFGEGGGYPVSY